MIGRKRVFIVDCENVGAEAFDKIESFQNAEVVLFLSQNVGRDAVYNFTKGLANTGATVIINRYTSVGKNSLDFKIVTYLTLRITENCDFYILSNDKGYLAATEYLEDVGFENVSLLRPIESDNETNADTVIDCCYNSLLQTVNYA